MDKTPQSTQTPTQINTPTQSNPTIQINTPTQVNNTQIHQSIKRYCGSSNTVFYINSSSPSSDEEEQVRHLPKYPPRHYNLPRPRKYDETYTPMIEKILDRKRVWRKSIA